MTSHHSLEKATWVKAREWGVCLLMPLALLICLFFVATALAGDTTTEYNFPSVGTPEFNQAYEEANKKNLAYQRMQVLTVDTRDQETCWEVADDLRQANQITRQEHSEFCYPDEENPMVSVYVMEEQTNELVIRFSDLSEKEQRLVRETRNLAVVGLAAFVALTLLPGELEGFEDFKWSEAGKNWRENVKAGPEWEDDHWGYNYVLHPLWGANSYGIARHAGFSPMQSFAYSVFVSTVLWEYGIEATEIRPSIQDLIITPVVGSLLGEFFYQKSMEIEANGGTLWGSHFWGDVALLIMNPGGTAMDFANNLFGEDVFVDSEAYISTGRSPSGGAEIRVGIRFRF